MGTMAASDVPCASRWPMPSTITRAGTMRMPPPTPNRPERNPAIRPATMTLAVPARPPAPPPRTPAAPAAPRSVDPATPALRSGSLTGAPFGMRAVIDRPSGPSTALCLWFSRCARSLVAPEPADRREHLLVVGELDDVAVGILERADVADVLGHLAGFPVEPAEPAALLGDLVVVPSDHDERRDRRVELDRPVDVRARQRHVREPGLIERGRRRRRVLCWVGHGGSGVELAKCILARGRLDRWGQAAHRLRR